MKNFFDFVVARLKEPSTHASIAVLLGVVGVQIAPDQVGNIALGAATVAGLFGVGLRERS
ncbi:MAG TPA: hypothetical protein VD860_18830 [Azospirillum sp.]|nr:hypothetical protein [Azospirillum sp.]